MDVGRNMVERVPCSSKPSKKVRFLTLLKTVSCPAISAIGLVFLVSIQASADNHAETSPSENTVIIAAVAPSWMRVTSDAGTIVFEGVLGAGGGAAFPNEQHNLRYMSGVPSAVYFWIDDELYGPAGQVASVIRDASLSPNDIRETFNLVVLEELSVQHRRSLELARNRYDE